MKPFSPPKEWFLSKKGPKEGERVAAVIGFPWFLFDINGRHLRLFQVRAGSDRRTIVDTWTERTAAHNHLDVTFSWS